MIPQIRPSEFGSTLVAEGDLDICSATALEAQLRRIEAVRPPVILLDLRPLSFIDLHGLDAILAAHKRAVGEHRRLVCIVGRAGPVRRLFELTGTIGPIEVIEDLPAEHALGA
jgi:anti-anti-sigma factor